MNKKALGTYHIAKICQVAPITVGRWIEEGKLPYFTTGGGHRRVWSHDLVKFLKDHNYPVPKHVMASLGQTVVIVDDDASVRKLIRKILNKQAPEAEIHEATNGFQAGEMISSLSPSLVILDIFLPGMDGIEVCRHIRSKKNLKKVKILAISGHAVKDTKDKILKAGADLFIEKPFKVESFSDAIKSFLG
jgi:CheY-like chemotaxis protein